MHVRISEEPGTNHVTTWQDFLRDNRSLPLDLLREIRSALERWRDFHLGGGAAPHVTLTRADCAHCREAAELCECDNCEAMVCLDCGWNYRTLHGETFQCHRCVGEWDERR